MKKIKLPLWVGIFLGISLFILALLAIKNLPDTKEHSFPTAILKITPYQSPTTISTSTQIVASTPLAENTSIPGVFSINMKVRVQFTGEEGLRIHKDPNIESQVLAVARENSLWIIIEGPTINEGRIWWKVQSLENGLSGWAVQDYLSIAY